MTLAATATSIAVANTIKISQLNTDIHDYMAQHNADKAQLLTLISVNYNLTLQLTAELRQQLHTIKTAFQTQNDINDQIFSNIHILHDTFSLSQLKTHCYRIQDGLTKAHNDIKNLMIFGTGIDPTYRDRIAQVDFTEPLGCEIDRYACEFTIRQTKHTSISNPIHTLRDYKRRLYNTQHKSTIFRTIFLRHDTNDTNQLTTLHSTFRSTNKPTICTSTTHTQNTPAL